MDEQNKKINFRYRCKINEVNYDIQLFNLEQVKIKIMINTKNSYSDEYVEYSNIYTLIQFQEITNYYILFQNIEEIFDDLARTIQEKNFSIKHNGNTITLKIKVMINKKSRDIDFILDKTKTIDLSSQKDFPYNNTVSTKSDFNRYRNNYLEKSRRNVAINDINELNTLLSDFKDRIAVLEQTQNTQIIKKEDYPTDRYINNINNMNNLMNSANSNYYNPNPNDKLLLGLENIQLRLEKLENENKNKDRIIKKLEQKLRYYESLENQEGYDNNIGNINNIPNIQNLKIPNNRNKCNKSQMPTSRTYQNKEFGFNNIPLENENPLNTSPNKIRIKKGISYTPNRIRKTKTENPNNFKLKNSNSFIMNNNYNDGSSFHSRETQKYNNDKFSDNQTNSYAYNNNDLKTNSSMASNFSNVNDKNFQKYLRYKEKLQIPIVQREDIKKFVNSRIIFTKNELRLLKTKFTQGDRNLHAFFDLLYRASKDGDYEDIVKSMVKKKEKTLTLFYTYEGARFGVYMHGKPSTSFIKGKILKEIPGTSFIVSLNNLKFFDILPNKTCKEGEESYLCFGRTFYLNSNGSNWIINTPRNAFLKKKCIIGNRGSDYINLDTELLVGVREEYHLKDVEIFEVCLERDDVNEEKESKKNEKKKKK